MSLALSVNGRYTTQAVTGVQRAAHQLMSALADLADETGGLARLHYHVPSKGEMIVAPPPQAITTRSGGLTGHAWEQLELPRAPRERWLYSPCNVGPLLARNHIVTIYDAQVFQMPASYSKAFGSWYRFLLPRLGHGARIVTTGSRYSQQRLEHFGVVPPGIAQVVYCGADHVLTMPRDESVIGRHALTGQRYLLAIGSLSPHKNIATIVAAMERVGRTGLRLVVAGGAPSSVFAGIGLESSEHVRFIGRVTDAELRVLYEKATAFMFPSLYEGFGLPPLEAMTLGCPVIASDIEVVREVCGEGVAYASPHDVDAWVAAVQQIQGDPMFTQWLVERGRDRARAFTWRNSAIAFWNVVAAVDPLMKPV